MHVGKEVGWLLVAVAALLAAACQTQGRAGSPGLPTLSGTQYGYGIERHTGQTVEVCGRLTERESRWAVEYIPREDDFFFHGYPAVLIAGCAGAAPRLDRDGCLTGRIAAADGSLVLPSQRVWDDMPVSRDWFLHPICSARG
ncbi:MAG TPA: hypothetical protein VEZ20_14205 [Allosphingosinicella sp.]|nr:hypothetical protein [Allosphingosinicella sp.]